MNNTTLLENTTSSVLEQEAEAVRHPLYIVLPVTLIYSIIFLTGVLGNVITCIVISNHKSMHTATNYYLFSLAISDLLLLISGLPQEMYNTWYTWSNPYPFNKTMCILQGFAAETSANATVLTITAFTVERYMAICHPFLSHTMSKLSRAIKFILAIWVLSMCMAMPQIWNLGLTKEQYCMPKEESSKHIFLISTVLVFAFPMVVITVLYVLIGLQLRKSKVVTRGTVAGSSVRLKVKSSTFKRRAQQTIITTVDHQHSPLTMKSLQTQPNMMPYQFPEATDGLGGNGNLPDLNSHKNPTNGAVDEEGRKNFSTRSQNYASRHVVNMLVAVVVAFFICWAPQHSQRLFSTYAQENNNEQVYITIYQTMTYTSGILYYLSTCINPFLYSIMSYKFREAFKETIAFSLHRRSTRPGRQDFGRLPANAQRPLVVSFRRFARPRPGDHDLSNVPISEKSSDDPTSSTASAEPILKSQCCGIAKMGNSAISIKPIPESFLPRRMDMGHRWSEDESIFPTQPTHLTRSDENLPQFVHEAIRENMYTPGQRHLSQTVGMQQSIFHTVQEKAQQFVSRHVYIDFNGKKSCRSPYDSPEMSNSSKQLEENLQKILEEVVLHPIKHAKPRRRVTDFIRLNGGKSSICCLSSAKEPNSTGSSVNSVFEGEQRRMAKSKSLPTFATLNVATSSESSQRSFYHPPDIFA